MSIIILGLALAVSLITEIYLVLRIKRGEQ